MTTKRKTTYATWCGRWGFPRRLAAALVLGTGVAFVALAAAAQSTRAATPPSPAASARCSTCGCSIASASMCRDCMAKAMSSQSAPDDDMRAGQFVYTLDNDLQRNSVAVYGRQSDGSLRMLPGSPFNAGGKGLSGGDIDEQGAVRVHGEFVLAVNPGSDSVAVMRRSPNGLLHVPGSPFPSGGSTPLSLAVHGPLVYVANQAAEFASPASLPNLAGFRLDSSGRLAPIPGSSVPFPKGAGPAQVEFSPDGTKVAVTSGFQVDGGDGSRVHAFLVRPDGRLTAGQGSPAVPDGGTGTVGFSWSAAGDRLYVSVFKGSGVLAFDVDPATAAIRQRGTLVPDDQRAACWTVLSKHGRTLYVGNFVSNSISVYDVGQAGMPTLLGSIPRRGAANADTKDIELSRDGRFLYAIGSGQRQISIFRVEANRLLTELPTGQSPVLVPTGQNVTGLVAD